MIVAGFLVPSFYSDLFPFGCLVVQNSHYKEDGCWGVALRVLQFMSFHCLLMFKTAAGFLALWFFIPAGHSLRLLGSVAVTTALALHPGLILL